MFCEHLSNKIRKNLQIDTAQENIKCTFFKISVGQKVVVQTSWPAHWEQKVGGQLPVLIGSAADDNFHIDIAELLN